MPPWNWRTVSRKTKDEWLRRSAQLLRENEERITEANERDLAAAPGYGLTDAAIDRLRLNRKRIDEIAVGLEQIAELADPIGELIRTTNRPNGLRIDKVRVPLGVVFFIYESRPNVTADAAAICVKSGNAVILRGGKEAIHSSQAIVELLGEAAEEVGLPADAVQLVSTTDRAAVGKFLAMPQYIDLAIPRGGEGLIRRVAEEAKMPVIKHFTGNCHVYVDAAADLDMAREIVLNSKCQRMGVCNAAESLVVHADVAGEFLPAIGRELASQRRRNSRRRAHVRAGPQRQTGNRRRLRGRVFGPDHFIARRRLGRRSHRAHQPLRLATHRRDRHDRRRRRPEQFAAARRQLGRDDQRQHAIQRRRPVRPRRRNRHQHRQIPRPRPLRPRRTDELQVRSSRKRTSTGVEDRVSVVRCQTELFLTSDP